MNPEWKCCKCNSDAAWKMKRRKTQAIHRVVESKESSSDQYEKLALPLISL